MNRTARISLAALFPFLLASRLIHSGIVWVEEAYPSAAAIQILHGKLLYRDFWFDKPPLSPYIYLLWGAHAGVILRVAGALWVFGCCLLLFRFASQLWSPREGAAAALLLGFFLTFDFPAAVMALAPDLLMVPFHIAAVYLAWRKRALAAGLLAGLAVCVNGKGVFVFAVVLVMLWGAARRAYLLAALGFLAPNAIAFVLFGRPYYEQVWQWGSAYSAHGFAFVTGPVQTLNWAGFHAALIVGAVFFFTKERAPRLLLWMAISLVAVAMGWRFFPRYFFQLLPVMALVAARGWAVAGRCRWAIPLLLAIPLLRFGPRYVSLANDELHGHPHRWSDLRLNDDSRAASALLTDRERTLLVWGYRPDVFLYTRMSAGTPFLDSQPLTGVIADRHLRSSEVDFPELARRNRELLRATHPDYIVDGLGPLNPALAITAYPDLRPWLAHYREIGRTELSVIYRRGD